MKTASLVIGILAIIGLIVGFFPCLGSLNWINIPFSIIGLIISIIALTQLKEGESRNEVIAGLILCGIALIFGSIRLIAGGGVL